MPIICGKRAMPKLTIREFSVIFTEEAGGVPRKIALLVEDLTQS
jgi:hypothetical protein